MMLNTRYLFECDYCREPLTDGAYEPIGTRRGVKVYVCPKCGLAQSFYTKEYQMRPAGNMSSNADRSSIRYTKSLVSDDYKAAIDSCFKKIKSNSNVNVLDIGSNRGAFVRYASDLCETAHLVCVEPDKTVVDYSHLGNVSVIIDRFENVQLKQSHFDIAYCVHTFEHVPSAKTSLGKIHASLKNGGRLILGVPRLELYENCIEELFIDPHTFHFRRTDIERYLISEGFLIEKISKPNHHDVIVVARKLEEMLEQNDLASSSEDQFSIEKYKYVLDRNRQLLSGVAGKIQQLSKDFNIVIWGAGRIFDALWQTQKFSSNDIKLFDKFIGSVLPVICGNPIISVKELLAHDKENTIIIVASRDYLEDIKKEARDLGFLYIKSFEEL